MSILRNKKETVLSIVGLMAISMGLSANVHAMGSSGGGGYKFSGIDGQLTLVDSLSPVVLRDKDGNDLVLSNTSVRLRLSDKSKDIVFMRNKNEAISVPIAGGFPGGNLRDFDLQASVIGQAFSIRGISTERTIYDNPFVHTRDCTFVCGQRTIIDSSTGDSRTDAGRSHTENVICNGLEEISSVTSHWSRTFELQFLSQDGAERAVFQGIADSSTSTSDSVLRSCGTLPIHVAPN